ncbi:MAG: ribosome recycling factor [Dehalococcoidia bacterium]|nr:ribosome recycling factor [Dehalococcoidia bacterium]MCA9851657.1 ribosome recycling factor [Dehalococcoidia bacterium]MCA9856148.1 ribosome recycling factor [Dehalococcoidia bacterium]MCB9483880.1 ribosome recycling factor [Dehalococcoidia bacterium]
MTDEILLEAEEKMDGAVSAVQRELQGIRTGRASTALVEHITVDVYGSKMQLIQLANLATPEAQLITITPFDKSTVDPIVKALMTSDIGITPNSDGRIIRLPIPPLTEQRRKELAKQVNGKAEDGRVSIRNIRRNANDSLKKAAKDGDISEDEERRALEEVEKLTSQYIDKVEALAKDKERELLEV